MIKAFTMAASVIALSASAAAQVALTKADKKYIDAIVTVAQNKYDYVLDKDQFGVQHHVQSVAITGKGDCEDWAIMYGQVFSAMRPNWKDQLFIWELYGPNINHAFLVLETTKGALVFEQPFGKGQNKRLMLPKYLPHTPYYRVKTHTKIVTPAAEYKG